MPTSLAARASDILVRPYSLGRMKLPNRLVMAPMTRERSPGGVPGPDVAAYYARRAAGQVGLVVTEGTYVGHESAGSSDRVPRLYGDEALAGWAAVTDAVHRAGGRIVSQLWHVGMDRTPGTPPDPEAPAIGPSGIALNGEQTGRAMAQADVDAVIAAFAAAATAAQTHGFDGIELHAAHGYLIDQFLWARTNRRGDAYGGDLASRVRFAAEIVRACRDAVDPDFPIQIRISQWKTGAYQARIAETPQELEAIVLPLAQAGVDAFHCSARRFYQAEFDGSDLNLAGWAKKLSGKPTISVGSVGLDNQFTDVFLGRTSNVAGIENLLDRMERDEFDLVAVGRALLGDPEWAVKILSGRSDELVPFTLAALGTLH